MQFCSDGKAYLVGFPPWKQVLSTILIEDTDSCWLQLPWQQQWDQTPVFFAFFAGGWTASSSSLITSVAGFLNKKNCQQFYGETLYHNTEGDIWYRPHHCHLQYEFCACTYLEIDILMILSRRGGRNNRLLDASRCGCGRFWIYLQKSKNRFSKCSLTT